MAGIAPVTLRVTADAAMFTAGLRMAESALDNWATKTMRKVSEVKKSMAPTANANAAGAVTAGIAGGAANVGAALQKAMGDPGRFLAENVMDGFSKIAGMVPTVGPILAVPFQAMGGAMSYAMGQFERGAQTIRDLGDASARTGVPVNDLRALMIAAGPASEMMDKGLFKLQQHVADASIGVASAVNSFKRLGIETKGLDKMPTIDLMKQLADKIKGVESAAVRARIVMDLMGRGGLALLPMMMKGSGAISKGQDRVEKFGLSVGAGDPALMRQALESKKTMDLFSQGVSNQFAIGVAPILVELTKLMGDLGVSAKGMSGYVISGFEMVAQAGAYVYDAWYGLQLVSSTLWMGFKMGCEVASLALIDFAISGIEIFDRLYVAIAKTVALMQASRDPMKAASLLKNGFGDIKGPMGDGGLMERLKGAREKGEAMLKGDKTTLGDMWASPSAMDKVRAFFDRVRATAASTAGAVSANQAVLKWFPKIDEMGKEMDGPLGVFREKMDELRAMSKDGVFDALGQNFKNQAAGMNFQKLAAGMQMPEKKFAGAAMQNSTEAYSAIIEHQFGDKNLTVQERIAQILEEQNARQQDQIRIGEELNRLVAKDPSILKGLQ